VVRREPVGPPAGTASSSVKHRVSFYETDAMGIVHHANFVNFLERARVVYMDEHDRPYREYMERGLHFATTRVEIDYLRPVRFDDVLVVQVWIESLRGASLRMGYTLRCGEVAIAVAATEHAMVDGDGRPRRIPREHRERLRAASP
jgi:acyl-CoA thioester hydrolase